MAAGLRGAVALLVVAPLLAACSLSETIGQHSVAYNNTVEAATDAVLVMNVLRARDRAPLHFSTIGAVHGAFNLLAGIGTNLSELRDVAQPAVLGSTSPSFDVGPLDRQEFARGLLRPLDPGMFRLLSDRGLPDQLLLHLLVSRFDEGPGGRSTVNDPRNRHALDSTARAACAEAGRDAPPPCDPFQATVDRLTRHGRLLFNGYTRLIPLGPRLNARQAAEPQVLETSRQSGLTLRPDGPGWRLYRVVDQVAICVPSPPGETPRYTALALDRDAPQVSALPQAGDPCTADEVADKSIPAGHAATGGLSWYLRSVEELLAYLGAVQRREEEGVPYRISIEPGTAGGSATPHLFRLWPEAPARPRFSVEYRGRRWWVAEHDPAEDLTLSVLALTTQLLNLQKSADEIPSSRTLRLVR
ncbi:MAG TPA: hypothetical protein VEX11_02130 [Acetobacteraceae bacterium]|nr:hypothetical protein [Acetobacteraceae bacterium]